jgi:hypothetical protein
MTLGQVPCHFLTFGPRVPSLRSTTNVNTSFNSVDVVVRLLRQKLGEESSVIKTVRGAGYRYRMPALAP